MELTRRRKLYNNAMRNSAVALASYKYGWPIDTMRQAEIAKEIDEKIETARLSLVDLVRQVPGIDPQFAANFNPGSSKQVGYLLYDLLQIPATIKTKSGGDSTGKEALQLIVDSSCGLGSEIAQALRDIKVVKKLREAYIDNLQGISLVRPQAHVTAQLSGRWSYKDPALQTVPKKIKPMFVAHPGCYMVACDLSQAELRNIAQLAGDENMMGAYNRGEDIHAATAMAAFGCTAEQAKEYKYRNPAKVIGLGYNYSVLEDEKAAIGLHGQLVAKVPGITLESVLGILRRLREARGGIRAYKERIWQQAQRDDYVEEPISGRRRYFWNKPKDTETFNFPCQAMTAHIVDSAVQGIHEEFSDGEGLHLQRHDELIVGGPDLFRLCDMLWRHLRQTLSVRGHTMTYEIEFEIGNRWGEGMACIEPRARPGQYDHNEAVCACSFGGDKAEITGLANAVTWVKERVPPASALASVFPGESE